MLVAQKQGAQKTETHYVLNTGLGPVAMNTDMGFSPGTLRKYDICIKKLLIGFLKHTKTRPTQEELGGFILRRKYAPNFAFINCGHW